MRIWIWIIAFSSFFAVSCKKEEGSTLSSNKIAPEKFYPLKVGSYFSYNVDSIYYDDFTGTSDTFYMQIKEVLADTFRDGSDQLNYRLERFYKYDPGTTSIDFSSISWTLQDVWFVTVSDFGIQRVEENIRKVSLINPVVEDLEWNGNAYNSLSEWEYEYSKVDTAYQSYDSCVYITQLDEENKIDKRYYEQVYARGIGLVRYYYIDVESQDLSNPAVNIVDRIEKGVQYTQELFDYSIAE